MPRPSYLANVTERDVSQCSNFTGNFLLEIEEVVLDDPAWKYIFWVSPVYQVRENNNVPSSKAHFQIMMINLFFPRIIDKKLEMLLLFLNF